MSSAKNLSEANIIRKVFDETTNSLRITGSLSVSAPVGGATEAKQDTQITALNSINSKLPANLTVTGNRLQVELPTGGSGLTDAELRASPVAVSATNLNTRGLTFAGDKVDATGSSIVVSNFPSGLATNAEQQTQTAVLSTLSQKSLLKVVEVSSLISASATPIPSVGALTLIASASVNIYRVQCIEDIGEYMALCTGGIGSEVVIAALPLGGGEVDVFIPSGTRISVKSLTGSNIVNSNLIINVLGLS